MIAIAANSSNDTKPNNSIKKDNKNQSVSEKNPGIFCIAKHGFDILEASLKEGSIF